MLLTKLEFCVVLVLVTVVVIPVLGIVTDRMITIIDTTTDSIDNAARIYSQLVRSSLIHDKMLLFFFLCWPHELITVGFGTTG